MQIFSHIEVQLLLNDNNFCNVANHVYVNTIFKYTEEENKAYTLLLSQNKYIISMT
jgi:hypothetical protein